ncbi:MAG: type IV secretion system DNA-binding domain-containing protein [Planctomycetaceae bacterium]
MLSHEELATLWHPPTEGAQSERLQTSDLRELEAPAIFPSTTASGSLQLGHVRFRADQRPVVLSQDDRRRHIYIVGKTGMGKSTLLQNMLVADITENRGVALIDPHGDLAESLLDLIPTHRTNDVMYFDAGSRDSVIGFNPLACSDPNRIDQVTSGCVSAMKKLYDSWGPRLEDTLRNAVFAIVERGGNLLSVMQLLGERSYREQLVPHIQDPVVRSFWLHEFASWSDNYRTEAVAAIQNKLRPFVVNSTIRAIVTHPQPALDFRQIMDGGRVLIVNLSKGRIGEDNSTLLGAMIVTCIQQAAMTRADLMEHDRRDFGLYVDEFQNFATDSFASVLSEARKFRLSLTIAHQYLAQLNEETSAAVFGNVGSIISFQVGTDDAERLALQLAKYPGQLTPENLSGLPKYTAYVRLLISGMPSRPFSMQTSSPMRPIDVGRAEVIRRVSRRRFSTSIVRDASQQIRESTFSLRKNDRTVLV